MNLNQVTLPVSNFHDSVAFYEGMGFQKIVEEDGYARFLCTEGDATFSLHQGEAQTSEFGVVIYFEVDDLVDTCQQLVQKGYTFLSPPTDEPWLWSEARIKDPSGNELCFYHAGKNRKNPPWRL